jgi:methyl-accepting chemotaxis protein
MIPYALLFAKRMVATDMIKWFRNLKIYHKLMVSFLLAALLTVVTGVVGIIEVISVRSSGASASQGPIIVLAVVTVVAAILLVLLGRSIAASIGLPIRLSVKVARMLSVGDLDVSEVVKDDHNDDRTDEYGELGQAFNALITNTQKQVETTQKIANGDLTIDVAVRSDKDLLGKSLASVVDNLNSLTASIISASNQVADGAGLLSNSNLVLSQGATEQASSIQQLTASVEQITAQINMSAKNAEKASGLVANANARAEAGNRQMADMLKAMSDINEASRNINRIIKVIDEIAFQTNILALNAAVEAARAGQHGKGFAVVAEEVRSLAGKSAAAVKETTDMIENSLKKVEAGTKIADETANALVLIAQEVNSATELIKSIAATSEEQVNSIEQINQGIAQVSQVVQSNAATSEEGAAASQELASQADVLKEMAGAFKVRQNMLTGTVKKVLPAAGRNANPSGIALKAAVSPNRSDFGKY